MLASTASITTLAWPSSRLITAVRCDRDAFSSGFCSRSRMAPRPGALPVVERSLRERAAAEARSISESTLPSRWPLRLSISDSMWWRSQGAAANWTRCVCSCRQTQSLKSSGGTWSSRSTATMLGATSSSRPPAGALEPSASAAKGSYWPRTLLDRNARTAPSWLPVMAPLTLAAAGLTLPRRLSSILSMAGLSITAKLCVLALAQLARSTTRTEESRRSRAASRPVISWTYGTEASARRRRLSTASPISAGLSVGPADASRAAVDAARSQLIRAWAGLDDAGADESRAVDSIVPIRSQRTADGPYVR